MSQPTDGTLLQWAECWSSHDADKFLSLFTNDCAYEDVATGGVSNGKTELRAFFERTIAAFPDFRVVLKSRFATQDRATLEWVMSGTHEGSWPGMPATHKTFSIRGASVCELKGERISRNSDYWDFSTFLKQVGLMPHVESASEL